MIENAVYFDEIVQVMWRKRGGF